MGVSATVGAAVIAAGATAYSTHEQSVQANKSRASAEKLAADARDELSRAPKLPNTSATAASMQQSQQQAATAGGTILGDRGLTVGDASGAPRKTLLGT